MARSAAPFTQFVKLLQRTAETPACLAGRCRIRTRCSSPRSRSCGRTTSEASGCESPPFPAKTRALIAAKRDAAMPSCPAEFDSARRVRFRPARPARRRAGESRASRLALLALLRRTDGGTRAMLATEQLSKKKSNDCFRRHPPMYPWRRAVPAQMVRDILMYMDRTFVKQNNKCAPPPARPRARPPPSAAGVTQSEECGAAAQPRRRDVRWRGAHREVGERS